MDKLFLLISLILFSVSQAKAEENNFYSYKIIDLNTSQTLAEHNAEKLMIPASTQKLITAYAALKELGDDYRFETKISANGKVINGTLHGNLYITFDGNPDFSLKELASIPVKLKALGIRNIKGDVIVDHSKFDDKYYPDGWLIEDKNFAFSAPISAIVIDQNSLIVKLTEKNGIIQLTEYGVFPQISNDIKIVSNKSSACNGLELDSNSDNIYRLYGCHTQGEPLPTLRIAIQNPKLWVHQLTEFYLAKNRVSFRKIEFGKTPIKSHTLFRFQSRPLKELLKTFLQDSNNLIGEVILKTMAAKKYGVGGFKEGVTIVENFLREQLKDDNLTIQIKDGSGLSRKNLVSANIFISLLRKIHHEPSIIKETLITAFPKSSINGTLTNRFTNTLVFSKGSIIAKTGYMENVSALVGYIANNSECGPLAFVVMINNTLMNFKEIKKAEERLVEHLFLSCNKLKNHYPEYDYVPN